MKNTLGQTTEGKYWSRGTTDPLTKPIRRSYAKGVGRGLSERALPTKKGGHTSYLLLRDKEKDTATFSETPDWTSSMGKKKTSLPSLLPPCRGALKQSILHAGKKVLKELVP